jgi:hypothetical protein
MVTATFNSSRATSPWPPDAPEPLQTLSLAVLAQPGIAPLACLDYHSVALLSPSGRVPRPALSFFGQNAFDTGPVSGGPRRLDNVHQDVDEQTTARNHRRCLDAVLSLLLIAVIIKLPITGKEWMVS